jgi:hypothetical protein
VGHLMGIITWSGAGIQGLLAPPSARGSGQRPWRSTQETVRGKAGRSVGARSSSALAVYAASDDARAERTEVRVRRLPRGKYPCESRLWTDISPRYASLPESRGGPGDRAALERPEHAKSLADLHLG